MIRIVTIAGSARPGNFTAKALTLVQDELQKHDDVELVEIIPASLRLGIPGSSMDSSDASRFREWIRSADGVILATPEYHGSFSSLMKLAIENMGFPSALAGKPVSLLGVASGRIGAVKSLEHLRSVCSHVGAIVLPGPVSIAKVRSIFDDSGNCLDPEMEKIIRSVATKLLKYVRETACPEASLEYMARWNVN